MVAIFSTLISFLFLQVAPHLATRLRQGERMFALVSILSVLVTLTNCFSFEKFSSAELLSISCDYATLVTRSRRSIPEPDLENPSALFDFLYPLADVKIEDHVGFRTVNQGSWMDDVGLLWQHLYCRRRPKRRGQRNLNTNNMEKRPRRQQEEHTPEAEEEEEGSVIGDMVSWAGHLGSYLPSAGEEEIVEDDDGNEHKVEISHEDENHDDEEKIVKVEVEEEEDTEDEDEESEEEDEEEESTTAPPDTTTTAAPKTADPYFSSYGGDIEYYVPLMSFTIPFDGQISLLGFHGFKGMFVY